MVRGVRDSTCNEPIEGGDEQHAQAEQKRDDDYTEGRGGRLALFNSDECDHGGCQDQRE
jgi:hypothetical protein